MSKIFGGDGWVQIAGKFEPTTLTGGGERMTELKPCPFCGGKAAIKEYSNGSNLWFRVRCDSCGVAQDGIRNDYGKKQAVEAWNRRVKE